jgi:hypothetical protein
MQATSFERLPMQFRLTHRLPLLLRLNVWLRTRRSYRTDHICFTILPLNNSAVATPTDWSETVKALANGAPATVADLHALLVAELRDQAKLIARANTDIYKAFWNINRHAQPTSPRPEEACRDTLIDRLRPRLSPHGISIEPEGHMVGDKRADISVAMPDRKILCELKRDYHPDVWTAAEHQLDPFYAHDPEAGGFGVYLAFWFGRKRPSPIPAVPGGKPRPGSAEEMELMLRNILPAHYRYRIAVLVIDVSGPPSSTSMPRKLVGKKRKLTKQTARTKKKLRRKSPTIAGKKKRKNAGKKSKITVTAKKRKRAIDARVSVIKPHSRSRIDELQTEMRIILCAPQRRSAELLERGSEPLSFCAARVFKF